MVPGSGAAAASAGVHAGSANQHASSRFHLDPSVSWGIYAHLGVHLYLVGAIGYLVVDQISDFTSGLAEFDAWLVQTVEAIVLAAIFFLDAIFYYKASCFAPWKRQPGVPFQVLPTEVQVALSKVLPCFRSPDGRAEEELEDQEKPTTQQVPPNATTGRDGSDSLASTTRSIVSDGGGDSFASSNDSSTVSVSPTPMVSRANSIVSTYQEAPMMVEVLKPEEEVVIDVAQTDMATPSSTVPPAPSAAADEAPANIGYFFPLCFSTCAEAFNVLAAFVCLVGSLVQLWPLVLEEGGLMETARYWRLERALDFTNTFLWAASAVCYHRDWQTHYSNEVWWCTSLDGTASMANVAASSLYLYASCLAIFVGATARREWNYLWLGVDSSASTVATGNSTASTVVDVTGSSFLQSSTAHLWSQIVWCGLLADVLYVVSALLYECSNVRHHFRARALRAAKVRREAEERRWNEIDRAMDKEKQRELEQGEMELKSVNANSIPVSTAAPVARDAAPSSPGTTISGSSSSSSSSSTTSQSARLRAHSVDSTTSYSCSSNGSDSAREGSPPGCRRVSMEEVSPPPMLALDVV